MDPSLGCCGTTTTREDRSDFEDSEQKYHKRGSCIACARSWSRLHIMTMCVCACVCGRGDMPLVASLGSTHIGLVDVCVSMINILRQCYRPMGGSLLCSVLGSA
jgi:hypothetical protein